MEKQKKPVIVREVWAENMEFEFSLVEEAIPHHRLIALDTEFPGTVVESDLPWHFISSSPDYIYDLMKRNLDVLKIVQLGLTLSDKYGNLPDFGTDSSYIWQFNFSDFDIKNDRYDPESIDMLEKRGIDFKKNREKGIDAGVFGARWLMSAVMNYCKPSLTWITFHGAYDIGFLIKMITGQNLPGRLEWFMKSVRRYLGIEVLDLKLMGYNHGLHGGLEKLGKVLGVDRIAGKSHEAGSDSLLTMQAFIRFIHVYDLDSALHCKGRLYGLCSKINQQQQHHSYRANASESMATIGIRPHCNFSMFGFYSYQQNYVKFF